MLSERFHRYMARLFLLKTSAMALRYLIVPHVLGIAAVGFGVGSVLYWWSTKEPDRQRWRTAGAALAVVSAPWQLLTDGHYNNHYYLLWLLALTFVLFHESVHARIVRALVSIVYGMGGLAKINGAYLSGDRLAIEFAENPIWSGLQLGDALTPLIAVASVVVEMVLAVGIWSARGRQLLWPVAIALHVAIVTLLSDSLLELLRLSVFNGALLTMWLAFEPTPQNRSTEPAIASEL